MGKIKHGYYGTPIYKIWETIKYRCYNKKYKHYDRYRGRNIIVCDEWKNNPLAFIDWAMSNGYRQGLQIDRINNNGNYEPSNCRFTTSITNNTNRGIFKNNKTGYKGICYSKAHKKYNSFVQYNNQKYNLGMFDTLEKACNARDDFILSNNLPNPLCCYTPKERG